MVAHLDGAATLPFGTLARVRKLIVITVLVLGAAVGLFSALHDDWGVKIVMMTIGAVVGAVLGGALTITGRRSRSPQAYESDDAYGQGTTAKDRDRNREGAGGPQSLSSDFRIEHGGGRRTVSPVLFSVAHEHLKVVRILGDVDPDELRAGRIFANPRVNASVSTAERG